MPSEQDHFDAVHAFLTAAGAAPFELSKLPATLPQHFTVITVSRMFAGTNRVGSLVGTNSYRITERSVARNDVSARELRRLGSALEGAVLTIGDLTSTPVQFETADPIAPDDEKPWVSGLRMWTYCL